MENQQKPKRKFRNLDLIILLSVLAVAMVCSGVVVAQTNQSQGEDFDLYIDYGGFAFQDGKNPSCFIAIYTPVGALNSSDNEFYITADGGGTFTFLANESVSLQFLKSVSANIEGDQGNGVRGINATETGLSGLYPVDPGDRVTIYWIPTVVYPYALPLISFWGMVGGALIGSIFTGAGIKKRSFKVLFVGVIAFLAAFIFYLVFVNL